MNFIKLKWQKIVLEIILVINSKPVNAVLKFLFEIAHDCKILTFAQKTQKIKVETVIFLSWNDNLHKLNSITYIKIYKKKVKLIAFISTQQASIMKNLQRTQMMLLNSGSEAHNKMKYKNIAPVSKIVVIELYKTVMAHSL